MEYEYMYLILAFSPSMKSPNTWCVCSSQHPLSNNTIRYRSSLLYHRMPAAVQHSYVSSALVARCLCPLLETGSSPVSQLYTAAKSY